MLLDSNIFIFLVQPKSDKLREWCIEQDIFASDITRLEVLGYHKLSEDDKDVLQQLFSLTSIISISPSVIERAISLRCTKKMTLGDAIIAATALEHRLTLATHNTKDFLWIPDLKVIDPIAAPDHA